MVNREPGSFDVTQTAEPSAAPRKPEHPSHSTVGTGPLQLRDASRYDLIGEHGRGGLGRVLRAHDKDLGRDVAIKELLERTHGSEVRFFREALITARLEHPNIVPVHEAGRWADGTPFYAMKLVSGRPLKDLIEDAKTLADRLALLTNVIAVVDAIAYAHDHRVIHRDLKPSNVIVGDFGETVVIDWGLAKVLDEADVAVDTPYRTAARDELTAIGSALGTPAYMAPEQAVGKSDERSDIYALGGILYQVLTGAAPNDGGSYPAGTPRDLISIAQRALAKQPEHRYARAMELGDDLRRFARRERVSARRYSLPARIALFTSRHKTFAVMSVAGLVALTVTLGISLAKIADQRADAFAARNEADFARKRAEDAKDALTLKHVELLMKSDPTAALAALRDYHGLDENRRRQLEAEARGRGVAREVIVAHPETVSAAVVDDDGAVISLGEDPKLQRTLRGTTTTLATNVAVTGRWARSATLLAYAAAPAGIALLDLKTRAITKLAQTGNVDALAFSPDGARLASIDHDGTLRVWQLATATSIVRDDKVHDAVAFAFAGPSRLVVWQDGSLRSIDLEHGTSRSVATDQKHHDELADPLRLAADGRRVVLGTDTGELVAYTPTLEKLATAPACKTAVRAVHVVGDRIAFACRDGAAGFATAALAIEQRFAFPSTIDLFTTDDDGNVIAATSDSTLYIHDRRTGITSRRDGHSARIMTVAIDHQRIATGDILGGIRLWDLPPPDARVIAELGAGMAAGDVIPDGTAFTAFGSDGTIHMVELATGATRDLRGHTAPVWFDVYSQDGATFLTPSEDATVRVWRRSDGASLRVFSDHHAIVGDVSFVDATHVVSAGDDGTLRLWSTVGTDDTVLFRRATALKLVEVVGADHTLVVLDATGAVWRVSLAGNARLLRDPASDPVTRIKSSPDHTLLAVGTEHGTIAVYRTDTWTQVAAAHVASEIINVRFDPQDRDLLVNAVPGDVSFVSLGGTPRARWTELPWRVIDLRYSPDGDHLAFALFDGTVWLYDMRTGDWAYTHDQPGDLRRARFTSDGRGLFTIDGAGTLARREIAATFRKGNP